MVSRARSFACEASSTNQGKRQMHNEQYLHEYNRLLAFKDDSESIQQWVEYRATNSRTKLRKRDYKLYEKEALAIRKFSSGERCGEIAKQLRVSTSFVYSVIYRLRQKGAKLES